MIPHMQDFLPYLGLASTDPTLVEFVKGLGYDLKLEPESVDDPMVNLCMKTIGIEMRFIKEAFLRKDSSRPETFILGEIAFYAAGFEGYPEFQGGIMHGLSLRFSRPEVRAKLGEPEKSGGGKKFKTFTSKEWDRYVSPGHYYAVVYPPGTEKVGAVSIALPDAINRGQVKRSPA